MNFVDILGASLCLCNAILASINKEKLGYVLGWVVAFLTYLRILIV